MTERITVSLSDPKVIAYLEKLRKSHKNISKAIENIMIEALKDEDQKEYEYIEKIVLSILEKNGITATNKQELNDPSADINAKLNDMFSGL